MKKCELCDREVSVYSRFCPEHATERRKERDRARKKQLYQDGESYAKVKEAQLRQREEKRRIVCDYLYTHPCVDCGEEDIVVLEFDHRGDKTSDVITMMNNGCSPTRMLNEILKCDVRCANCHRRKTNSGFGGTYRERWLSLRNGPAS